MQVGAGGRAEPAQAPTHPPIPQPLLGTHPSRHPQCLEHMQPVPTMGQEEDALEAFPLLGRGNSGFGEWEGMKSAGCRVSGVAGQLPVEAAPAPSAPSLPADGGAQHSRCLGWDGDEDADRGGLGLG